jgi:hypothetical protein
MKPASPLQRLAHTAWPVVGGAWGAWLGLGGYFGLARNADSFGSFFASGYFLVFGLIGLISGALAATALGRWFEALLLRTGLASAAALLAASVLTALLLWQAGDWLHTRFPGLRAESPRNLHPTGQRSDRTPAQAAPPASGAASTSTCAVEPPKQSAQRNLWEAECL